MTKHDSADIIGRLQLYKKKLAAITAETLELRDFVFLIESISKAQVEKDLKLIELTRFDPLDVRATKRAIAAALKEKPFVLNDRFTSFVYESTDFPGSEPTTIDADIIKALCIGSTSPLPQLESVELATQLALVDSTESLLSTAKMKKAPFPYQERTVRRFINQMHGCGIVADEVGLGKTIEAGMIIQEYFERGLISSCLIIVPPTLVSHWERRLAEFFPFPVTVPESLEDAASSQVILTSIHRAKGRFAETLLPRKWGLVVVDECHILKNHQTQNFKFIYSLSKKYCLLLSATPVQNEVRDLYNLVTLCRPGLLKNWRHFRKTYIRDRRRPIQTTRLRELISSTITRTRRTETGRRITPRHPFDEWVKLTEEEHRYHENVYQYVRFIYDKHSRGSVPMGTQPQEGVPVLELLLIMILKELASSKKAVEKTLSGALRKRIMALAARTGDTDDLTKLNRVIASVRACEAQTKQDHLIKKFDQLRKLGKIIIFTEFLETQADLQKRLSARGIGCVIFKGGEMKEKENAIDTFRTPSCDVMISTETGAQGLDLEFANVIVNFDFPWNPMRLEQRIGRVDRPKQEHDIYVFNLFAKETIEDYIVTVLNTKLQMAEKIVGEIGTILSFVPDVDVEGNIGEILLDSKNYDEVKLRLGKLGELIEAGQREYQSGQKQTEEVVDEWLKPTFKKE